MILWLIGPPGVGKSTVGPLLAEETGRTFLDLDRVVTEKRGRTPAEILRDDGEPAFREIEAEIVDEIAISYREDLVVATGGGTLLADGVADVIRSTGIRIRLNATSEQLAGRIAAGGEDRPLIGGSPQHQQISAMLRSREHLYADSDVEIDTNRSPREVASMIAGIVGSISEPAWELNWQVDGGASCITAWRSPVAAITALWRATAGRRVFLLTDENLQRHYPETINRISGTDGVIYVIEPGEESKRIPVAERIVERLSAEGFDRADILVCFGGGVVTDLGGFVASIYMRGIDTVSVPTSTLCMVDATVGGKTAVNAGGVRNLVGTFAPAGAIMVVPAFLRTLPDEELRAGLVESVKMGIISAPDLLSALKRLEGRVDGVLYSSLVKRSIETKIAIIGEDLRDHSSRRLLNFGHTIAHALEGAAPGLWRHGEAVAFGMVAETLLGAIHHESPLESERVKEIIGVVLPFTKQGALPDRELLFALTSRDKKNAGGVPQFVVPIAGANWDLEACFTDDQIISAAEQASARIESFHTERSGEPEQ